MRSKNSVLAASLAVAGILLSGGAAAESGFATGVGPSVVNHVDFSIVIPSVLRFQVGTAGVGNIDTITFQPGAAILGDSSSVAATAGSGDLGNGAVTVLARGNNGTITIATAVTGGGNGMDNGTPADGYISWDDITTTSVAGIGGGVTAPTLLNAGIANVLLVPPSGKVNNRTATWTYAYDNVAFPAAGTYTGQVTYTASMP